MSKKVFDGIMAGLRDAIADVRGEPGHVVEVTTIVPVDVKSVREKTGLSQKEFSRTFGVPSPPIASESRGSAPRPRLLENTPSRSPATVSDPDNDDPDNDRNTYDPRYTRNDTRT